MLNPNIRIAKSKGVDLPVMYVYLGGRIAGNVIDKCIQWRKDIINHYKNYKKVCRNPEEIGTGMEAFDYESYPISFLDPLNSGEAKSVDKLGLTSEISPNLIYAKDLLSVEKADVVIVNMEDFFEEGIEKSLYEIPHDRDLRDAYNTLKDKIKNRRENFGTICEFAIALYLQKPIILICPENRKEIYMKHPFAKRSSVIVTSVDELIKGKYLETLYKSIAGATY